MSTSVYKLESFKMGHKAASRRTRTTPEKVKRSLFGPVDHEANRIFIESQLMKEYNRGCRKWNFNFREEVPLDEEGDYVWTTPSPILLSKKRKAEIATDTSSAYYFQPIEAGSGQNADFTEPIKPVARSPEGQARMNRVQRQSQITDYMVISKRSVTTVHHLKETSADERPKKIRKTLKSSS